LTRTHLAARRHSRHEGRRHLSRAGHAGLRYSLIHRLTKAAHLAAHLRSESRDAATGDAAGLAHAAKLSALSLTCAHLSTFPRT